jgi:hypothetical protein
MEDSTPEATSNPNMLGPTASAISAALDSNIALQGELKRRLAEVRRLKLQNRSRAAEVTKSLSICWNAEPYHRFSESNQSHVDEDTHVPATDARPQLNFNPNRRWTRHFFVDEAGTTPNLLLGEAASLESPGLDSNSEGSNEIKLQSAWAKADIANLQRVVHESLQKFHMGKSEGGSKGDSDCQSIPWQDDSFFQEVASNLNISPPRSAGECRSALLTFADVNIVTAKFTKDESLFILHELSQCDGGNADWCELTSKLNSKFYSEPNRRTPWQCFRHYKTNLRDSTNPPWTAEEDELLLKYIAAHGPQFAFGESAIPQACQNLFELRDPKLVVQRAHNSLMNPNFVQDRWDIRDQRKLALLMRAYSDKDNTLPSVDHFPHRAQSRVASKWDRSLNPAVSHKPFTQSEDKKLLAAMKGLGSDGNASSFASVAKLFPNRTTETLWYRWTELADEKDVVSKLQTRMIEKKKRLLGNDENRLLSTDDFVVQKKKPKT